VADARSVRFETPSWPSIHRGGLFWVHGPGISSGAPSSAVAREHAATWTMASGSDGGGACCPQPGGIAAMRPWKNVYGDQQ
jgi:hypothetical protein